MTPFNLLQYPALASQRRKFHSRWTATAGLVVGSLAALWLMAGVQEKQLQLAQEVALLQSRLKQAQQQVQADQARQAKLNTWVQQATHVQTLSAQQRLWEALHQALLQEAGPDSVQLLRLQLNAQTLELHGQAKDVQRMAQARDRLSLQLADLSRDASWTLVSLVSATAAEVQAQPAPLEFVWQTAWPPVGSGSVAAAPATDLQSSGPGKERP
jgi:Tfp pilus assembly protein PilN